MELTELRSLVLLAEMGSLAQVSRKLNVTAPAVHKQLKTLEAELGVRLYEKEGRGLRLTQAADILLPYARDMLAQNDGALRALEEWRGLKRGLVRIGAGPTLSSYVLPPMLKRFRRAHPSIDLVVESGNTIALTEGLRNGALDLALLVSSQMPEEPGLNVEASWAMEYVLVTNLPAVRTHCQFDELRKFPFMLFRKGSRIANLIDHYFAEIRFQPNAIMTFDNGEAIKAMIRNGFGIAMLPYWIVDEDVRNRALRLIQQKERRLFSSIDLVSRSSKFVPRPTAAFSAMARNFVCRNPRLISSRRG